MKKTLIITTLLLVCVVQAAWAQKEQFNPVQHGVTSLMVAPDSRGGGMGDIGAATDPDVYSQYWNPAKYPFNIARAGLGISYTPGFVSW